MGTFKLSKERVAYASNIIIQFLRDSGYTGSVEDGTGISDVVIKPSSLVYELMAQLVDKSYAYQSLQKALELKETIGQEEYDAAVDCILSNWFVTRNDGKPSTGTVRLWFKRPLDFCMFQDGKFVGTAKSTPLVADGQQVFSEADFSCVVNAVSNEDEYYIDVVVRTSTFSDTIITTDDSVSISYEDIYFLRGELPANFVVGTLIESSEDFIRRTEQAITTRELITARAINTVLLNEFDEIYRLYVARHGSSEQLRDIVEFEKVLVHVGNKADIYLASAISKQTLSVVVAADGSIDIAQLPASTSVLAIIDIVDELGAPVAVEYELEESRFSSSGYLPTSMKCPAITAETRVTMTILTSTLLKKVHEFVYADAQRVACYDPMVKHMFPMILDITVNVVLLDKTVDSANDILSAILLYVDSLGKTNNPWVCSELVAFIHNAVPNVHKVMLPVECTGRVFDPKTMQIIEATLGNTFTIDTDLAGVIHSAQVTSNTVQLYTDSSRVTVNIV